MEEQCLTADAIKPQTHHPLSAALLCLLMPGLGFFILRDFRSGLFYLSLYQLNFLLFIAAIILGIPYIGALIILVLVVEQGLRILSAVIAFRKAKSISTITVSMAFKSILVSLASFLIPGLGHFIIYKRVAAVFYFFVFLILEMLFYATDYITDAIGIVICILMTISCIDAYLLYYHCDKRIKAFAGLLVCTVSYYAAVFAVVFAVMCFVVRSYRITSDSMNPTLYTDDRILANKLYYKFHEPRQGDIVVFRADRYVKNKTNYVKRILAVSGQVVRFEGGSIWVDGKEVDFLPENTCTSSGFKYASNCDYFVSTDSYFLIGDNINESYDSRMFGPVSRNEIVGKATYLYWPFSERKTFK